MEDLKDSVPNKDHVMELHREISFLLIKAGIHARKHTLRVILLQDLKADVELDSEQCAKPLVIGA